MVSAAIKKRHQHRTYNNSVKKTRSTTHVGSLPLNVHNIINQDVLQTALQAQLAAQIAGLPPPQPPTTTLQHELMKARAHRERKQKLIASTARNESRAKILEKARNALNRREYVRFNSYMRKYYNMEVNTTPFW